MATTSRKDIDADQTAGEADRLADLWLANEEAKAVKDKRPPVGGCDAREDQRHPGSDCWVVTKRVCAEPGCPTLTNTTRCPDCTRAKDRARGTSTERGYGAEHQRLRRRYQLRMEAGEVFHCWRCGNEIDRDAWHLGHDDHDRSVYRGPECVPCNDAVSGR